MILPTVGIGQLIVTVSSNDSISNDFKGMISAGSYTFFGSHSNHDLQLILMLKKRW